MPRTSQRNSPAFRKSPKTNDSPSQQLFRDLERALSQIQLHESEVRKVNAYHRRSFLAELDARDLEKTKADIAQFEIAAARHEAIRDQAEAELQRHVKEVEEAEWRRRAEEEARLAKEKAAREKAERERQEREEAERKAKLERELEKQRVAQAKRAAEEKAKADAEAKQRQEAEEKQAEVDAKKEAAKQAVEAARKAREESQKPAVTATPPTATASPSNGYLNAELEATHKRYLQIHGKLKAFRKDFTAMLKENKELKGVVGDMRRGIRTSVGQLTDNKQANKKAHDRVKLSLLSSLNTIPSPPAMISDYLLHPLPDPNQTIPSLTIYLLNIFSKAVISAFAGECAVNPKAAEPIGTLVAQIFAMAELQFPPTSSTTSTTTTPRPTSLIPILLSKLHHSAPQLFGLSLPTPYTTASAKAFMGWRAETSTSTKTFIPTARQIDRLTGLAAGYTSIALRNFSRSRTLTNPYPPSNFWTSFAGILATPKANISVEQVVMVKAMLEVGWERVVMFWGGSGVGLLRAGGVDWVAALMGDEGVRGKEGMVSAVRGLEVMVEGWRREGKFTL